MGKNDFRGQTISLYKDDGFTGLFARIRFWDAPFTEIEKLLPREGRILDLGCGDGILVNYLALSGPKRELIGIEKNRERLKFADKGLRNTTFFAGDVLKKGFPRADIILMIHLLHHLPSREAQEKLIKKTAVSLRAGGKLIIAEVSQKPFWKYLLSWITDAFLVPILFEGKIFTKNIYYRKDREWRNLLSKNGFTSKMLPVHKHKPFSHSLIVATKINE